MRRLSKPSTALALVLASGAVFGGLTFGGWPWWLLGASVLLNLRFIVEATRLFDWGARPLLRPRQIDRRWQDLTLGLHTRLRRERQRIRDLLTALRGLRAITRSLPDAAIVINENGEIQTINPAAERMLKLKSGDVGQSLSALLRHPDFLALLKGQATEDSVELPSPFIEGQRLEARWLPVSATQSLVVVRDVTQLTKLLTMRQDFIANVSHELRTPLTVVKGYLEALGDGDLEPDMVRTIADRLQSPTHRMQALVDDLLLLTRLESSPDISEKDREAIDMRRVLEAVRREVQVLLQNNQELKIDLACDYELYGIESEVHSAVTNLVTNALRYSPDGGVITVTWRCDSAAENKGIKGAELRVEDQGVGIAPEHISRITERFYRVDLTSARVRGGTGLGLAIVKHVLKRHSGRLEVESELGVGSRFTVHFPAAVLADPRSGDIRAAL